MISQQIDAVQERIEAKPDIMDVDGDGNTLEVAHEDRELVGAASEDYVPYRRGR